MTNKLENKMLKLLRLNSTATVPGVGPNYVVIQFNNGHPFKNCILVREEDGIFNYSFGSERISETKVINLLTK